VQERHLIAIYCRFRDDDRTEGTDNYSRFPEHVINRVDKARDVYSRLTASHPDSEYTRIVFFGQKSIEALKQYGKGIGLPEEKIELVDCRDIATMAKKIWSRIKNNNSSARVYFVLSNWQWVFLDPLISVKDDLYKFYFEGAVDERHPNEIELDKKKEKVAKIDLKESKLANILDKVGGSLSDKLKG